MEMKNIRLSKGLTVDEVAQKTGLSKAQLWSWESGRREPDLAALVKLADALDVSLDMLIRGKEKEPHQTERLEDNVVDAIAELPPDHQKIALAVLAALQSRQGE